MRDSGLNSGESDGCQQTLSAIVENHSRREREDPMPRGEFKLIIGNMFGNKTGRLMLEVETLRLHPDKYQRRVTRSEPGETRI